MSMNRLIFIEEMSKPSGCAYTSIQIQEIWQTTALREKKDIQKCLCTVNNIILENLPSPYCYYLFFVKTSRESLCVKSRSRPCQKSIRPHQDGKPASDTQLIQDNSSLFQQRRIAQASHVSKLPPPRSISPISHQTASWRAGASNHLLQTTT